MFERISVKKKKKAKRKKSACLDVPTSVLFKCSFHIDCLQRKSPLTETTLSFMADLWQPKQKRTRQHVATSAESQSEKRAFRLLFILTAICVCSPSVIIRFSAANNSRGITCTPPDCEEWALCRLPGQFGILTGRLGKFPSYSYLHQHPLPLPSPIPPYYLRHLAWR